MVQLLSGDPFTNASWLFSIAELPNVYWSTVSSIGASINRGNWADPVSGILRSNRSGATTYEPITITKPFMDDQSQGELNNFDIIRQIVEWHQTGKDLSAALSPCIRGNGIELRGTNSIQLENCKIQSYNLPGDVDIGDGATTSVITVEMSFEYLRV